MKDRHIVERLQEGSKTAFQELYDNYWGKVYNYCKLYLTDSNTINECTQDVFVRLWESKHLINVNKNLEGYIFIITRNIIFQKSKEKINYTALDITVISSLSTNMNAENSLIEKELMESIDILVAQLPPRQQEVFNLSRYQSMSYKEITEKLGITEKTVERHINEALKFIRSKIRYTFVHFPFL